MRYELNDPWGQLAQAIIDEGRFAQKIPPKETPETPAQRKKEDIILAAGSLVTIAAMAVAIKGNIDNDFSRMIEGVIAAQIAYSVTGAAVLINNFNHTINRARRFWLE